MNSLDVKIVNDFAEKRGIIAGVCDCRRLYAADEGELSDVPFVTPDIRRRLEPALSFEAAKSIIVIGVSHKKAYEGQADSILRGRISQSAAGTDYHVLVNKTLEALAVYLLSSVQFNYRIFVDTGNLTERSLAVTAGLGYIGKNRAVISEKLGSLFNIGYMLTDLELITNSGTNTQAAEHCPGGCRLCIDSCPGGALTDSGSALPGKFDYRKCVSYLTQKKSDLTAVEIKSMRDWVYGCDICQTVCPKNANTEAEIINDIDSLYPALHEIIKMDNEDFKNRFGSTAVFWRGKRTIIRNALNSVENIKKMEKGLI